MSLNWQSLTSGRLPDDGPIAFDSDLSAANLRAAALAGFYCFPASTYEQTLLNDIRYAPDVNTRIRVVDPDDPNPYAVAWLNPHPRPVIDLTARGAGRTMRRFARRRAAWRTTIDRAFDAVVTLCARHHHQTNGATWITGDLQASLRELHHVGVAHSCEVWDDDQLIGGVFGLQLGTVFSADSQFTIVEGAGKLAVVDLVTRFAEGGGALFDLQHDAQHTRSLGAAPMSRSFYLDALQQLTDRSAVIPAESRSAQHIANLAAA